MSYDDFKPLLINRRGKTNNAFMQTNHLITVIPPYSYCMLVNNVISVNDSVIKPNNNNYKPIINNLSYKTPPQCCIPVLEPHGIVKSNEIVDNNILGSNHILYVTHTDDTIQIPIADCNTSNLAYYGAELITPENPYFQLHNSAPMPLFNMTIGCDYITDYLLQSGLGDGFYMEKHNTPHVHIPVNTSSLGYYILGNIINYNLYATAFEIPTQCAIYTPPNIYHCDGSLIGQWNVMYACASEYITYIIRNSDNTIPKLKFI